MGKSFSNDDQKAFLSELAAQHELPAELRVKLDNFLFNDDFLEYLALHPEAGGRVGDLFHLQFTHLSHSND
jgi:hypothetical protein